MALGRKMGLGGVDVHGSHPCLGRKLEKLREKERKKEAKRKISSLSFTLEEEEAGEEEEEMVAMDEEELEREGEGRLGMGSAGRALSGSRMKKHVHQQP